MGEKNSHYWSGCPQKTRQPYHRPDSSLRFSPFPHLTTFICHIAQIFQKKIYYHSKNLCKSLQRSKSYLNPERALTLLTTIRYYLKVMIVKYAQVLWKGRALIKAWMKCRYKNLNASYWYISLLYVNNSVFSSTELLMVVMLSSRQKRKWQKYRSPQTSITHKCIHLNYHWHSKREYTLQHTL